MSIVNGKFLHGNMDLYGAVNQPQVVEMTEQRKYRLGNCRSAIDKVGGEGYLDLVYY